MIKLKLLFKYIYLHNKNWSERDRERERDLHRIAIAFWNNNTKAIHSFAHSNWDQHLFKPKAKLFNVLIVGFENVLCQDESYSYLAKLFIFIHFTLHNHGAMIFEHRFKVGGILLFGGE